MANQLHHTMRHPDTGLLLCFPGCAQEADQLAVHLSLDFFIDIYFPFVFPVLSAGHEEQNQPFYSG
jgi:hypothetical protein